MSLLRGDDERWPRPQAPDEPTPERLRAWADWFDHETDGSPREAVAVVSFVNGSQKWDFTVSDVLCRVADALERAGGS